MINLLAHQGTLEDEKIARTVESGKEVYPEMYFQRIGPLDIMTKFSLSETALNNINFMEEITQQYIRTNEEVKKGFDLAIERYLHPKLKCPNAKIGLMGKV